MEFNEILKREDTFRYMLLDRMRADCEYYLGFGNRHPKNLWAGDEAKQIAYMKALWNSFDVDGKPEWLSYSEILDYAERMGVKWASVDEKTMVVKTLRNREDAPETAEIKTPFEIGQTIDLEYDLPAQKYYSGYSSLQFRPGGKAVGSFEVIDVVLNTLINPNLPMIKVKSQDEKFNALYPDSKTMLIFEDVVIKRWKNRDAVLTEEANKGASGRIEDDIPAIIESFTPGQRLLELDTHKTIELTRQEGHGIWNFKVYDANDSYLYDASSTETRLAADVAAGYVVSKAEIVKKKSLDEKICDAAQSAAKNNEGKDTRTRDREIELS